VTLFDLNVPLTERKDICQGATFWCRICRELVQKDAAGHSSVVSLLVNSDQAPFTSNGAETLRSSNVKCIKLQQSQFSNIFPQSNTVVTFPELVTHSHFFTYNLLLFCGVLFIYLSQSRHRLKVEGFNRIQRNHGPNRLRQLGADTDIPRPFPERPSQSRAITQAHSSSQPHFSLDTNLHLSQTR
jgi:hypothetical protein